MRAASLVGMVSLEAGRHFFSEKAPPDARNKTASTQRGKPVIDQ